MMNTQINHLPGLDICLTTHGYADTHVHAKSCLATDLSLKIRHSFVKDFDIKPILASVKNPQANAPVERVHQVILNILVTKDLDNKVFDYIYPWGETLASISCAIRASYHCTTVATSGQAVFVGDILFNLASVIDWRVATDAKQRQVYIDNDRENAKQFKHD